MEKEFKAEIKQVEVFLTNAVDVTARIILNRDDDIVKIIGNSKSIKIVFDSNDLKGE